MNTKGMKCMEQETKTKGKFKEWTKAKHWWRPSYLGGRDQEDHRSKPAQENSM
jgi:hypothetical protein